MPEATVDKERYEILDELGRGGMATVFRAYDGVAEDEVAIKVIHRRFADDEAMVEAFQREAALMQQIDHQGVVRVFGTTEIDGRAAIVMELLDGGVLRDRILATGGFDEDQALPVMEQILEALSAVHQAGMVHRDVKPHNVVFDGQGRPKLIDFGIGQAQELLEIEAAGQVGTVEYMAPEQIDGMAVDGRADLYAAGIMFFELLCGHVPYRADSAAAVMRMHRDAEVPDPRFFEPQISERVAQVIIKALAKHPADRFSRADEMRAVLNGEQESLPPVRVHREWTRLVELYDSHGQMAADPERDGHEWVVFSGTIEAAQIDRLNNQFYAIERVEREYDRSYGVSMSDRVGWRLSDFLRDIHRTLLAPHSSPGINAGPGVSVSEPLPDTDRANQLRREGIARGLTRQGAEKLVGHLESLGATVRIAKTARFSKGDSWLTRFLLDKGTILGICLIFGMPPLLWLLLFVSDPAYAISVDLVVWPALLVAVMAGIMVAYVSAGPWIQRTSPLSMGSSNYRLDFTQAPQLTDRTGLVGLRQLELVRAIQSPRAAASFERAVSLTMHAAEVAPELHEGHPDRMLDELSDLGDKVVRAEEIVATIRPADLASRIRRLDRQIAGSDDRDEIDELMEEKARLRRQLEDRDEAQENLEGLAQQLLDRASRLEEVIGPRLSKRELARREAK